LPVASIAPPPGSCTDHSTIVFAVPVTIALNGIEPPAITDAVCGMTETATGAVTLTVAVEKTVGSATDLASTWYVPSVWGAT